MPNCVKCGVPLQLSSDDYEKGLCGICGLRTMLTLTPTSQDVAYINTCLAACSGFNPVAIRELAEWAMSYTNSDTRFQRSLGDLYTRLLAMDHKDSEVICIPGSAESEVLTEAEVREAAEKHWRGLVFRAVLTDEEHVNVLVAFAKSLGCVGEA